MNIKFNNETIKNAIMDALDKMERGIEIDRNELINVILKYGDRDFGIKNGNRKYTEEELQNSVYIHIVNENNKCYIGQTSVNPKDRWGSNGAGYIGQVVYNPIKKYGWTNTSHIVICNGLTQEQVDAMETLLIFILKSTNREFGYNVDNGGNGVGKRSEETRQKISEAHKGKLTGEKNPSAKAVFCDGKIFPTIRQCADFYGVCNKTMTYWLKHTDKMNSKFIELGLRDATEEDVKIYPICTEENSEDNKVIVIKEGSTYAKKVYCNEMIFKSVGQCAKFYKVDPSIVSRYLNKEYKRYSKKLFKFIKLELRFATEEDIENYPLYIEENKNKIIEGINVGKNPSAKAVFCNGKIFPTLTEFANFCNVSPQTMSNWLNKEPKIPSKKLSNLLQQGLRFATEEDIENYPLYIEEEQTKLIKLIKTLK